MQDKTKDLKLNRYQIKTVKKSVRNKQISVETGN